MPDMPIDIDEAGRIKLFEITVEVHSLIVKLLFNQPPTIQRVCDAISTVFAGHVDVEQGIIALLLSLSDNAGSTVLEVGDEIKFEEDETPIGFIGLETRTLFES